MPFIWNDHPNSPSEDLPIPVPPGEISYEQREVANLVNAGGTITYNTPNVGFDIVYDLASLNVRNLQVTTLNAGTLTINTARISTATINRATINTANFGNVTIQYGFMGNNPGSNLEIATKGYVDAAAANVPAGGSDLQNIIDAKGDLLVGIAPNTAARLPVGSNGQILSVDASTNTGLVWKTIGGATTFHNLWIQTHWDLALKDRQVLLRHADEIIMNDGTRVSGWSNMTADISLVGAGGLDTGVEEANHWYEVYAIANSLGSEIALTLHKASEILQDQAFTTTTDNGRDLRKASGGVSKIGQSFIPANTGPLTSVEVELSRVGTPTGLIWVTLQPDNANNLGFPSDTILATSRIMDPARLPLDKARMRFLFDTNTNITMGSTYHLVYQGSYSLSDTNYTRIWGTTAGGYASGRANEFRIVFSDWVASSGFGGPEDLFFKTFVQNTPATEVILPAEYDQQALISYVYNNSAGDFKQYTQKNRTIITGVWGDWRAFTAVTGLIEAVDLVPFIPPVTCSVKFAIMTAHASPRQPSPIGGVAATDMPATIGTSAGQLTANVRHSGQTSPGVSIGLYGNIIVENQVMLARMLNVDSRLYTVATSF